MLHVYKSEFNLCLWCTGLKMEATAEASNRPCLTICDLPNELIVIILKNLNASGFLSFSATCTRFSRLCQTISNINFDNSHSNGLSTGNLSIRLFHKFLQNHNNPSLLKSFNVNGCYWIEPCFLEAFLVRCQDLEKLYFAETSLSINQFVIGILPFCPNITTISFTLEKGDWSCEDPLLLGALQKLVSIEVTLEDGLSPLYLSDLIDFLSNCTNLEELVITRVPSLGARHAAFIEDLRELMKKTGDAPGPLSKLKSFIFVAQPLNAPIQSSFNMGPTDEQRRMATFWSNTLDINYPSPKSESNLFTSLSWNVINNQQLPELNLQSVRLPTLESLWEPFPVFMQSPASSPQLRLANIIYDGSAFTNFCAHHEHIEVLRIRRGKPCEDGTDKASILSWNDETWNFISNLRAISVDASLIAQREQASMKRKWEEEVDESYVPFMKCVVQKCLMIQELEIIGSGKEFIKGVELAAIAECLMLKRLTLTDLMVPDGKFLEKVLENCELLEILRLKDIGPLTTCCYIPSLLKSLPDAKKLRTFIMFQDYIRLPDFKALLDVLKSCFLLTRISLIFPAVALNMSTEEFCNAFVTLCYNLNQLVALFAVLKISHNACFQLNNVLRQRFRKERPAFCVHIKPMTENHNRSSKYHSSILPRMHSNVLTSVESSVANYPFNFEPVLQRLV